MRTRPVQNSFSSGEWAPRLYGRSDLKKYWNSAETLENVVLLPYGGVARRGGFQYVAEQGDETRKARLIPFIFSTEQAYVLEFGHEYIHVYMNHGKIVEDDPHDVLLLHFNGDDASTTITDDGATGHTVTVNSLAQLDTYQKKFGQSSLKLNVSTSDYLTVADHADFDFSSKVFTIECFFRLDFNTTFRFLCSQSTDASNYMAFYINDDTLKFEVREAGGTVQTLSSAADSVVIDTWYHARVVGNGTNYYLFLNGVLVDSEAISENIVNYTGTFHIGKFSEAAYYFSGWIDEFRVNDTTVGITSFSPPNSQYPNDSSGTDPVEVTSPYAEEDLPNIKYFQSFDTMYLFHPDYEWRKLTRTAHDTWTLSYVNPNGPWEDAITGINVSSSGTTGSVTLTTAADFFEAADVGSLLRLQDSNDDSWGYGRISAVATARSATLTVVDTLGSSGAYDYQQWSTWNSTNGYPSSGCFNEESLLAFATDAQPQTIWASVKGDYENFLVGTNDDDAFIYTIPASNRILWPGVLRDLAMGTGDGIYRMTAGIDDFISPTNVRVKPGLKIGAANIEPVLVNKSLLYWQKGGQKLRELTYDPQALDDSYAAPDLTLLSEHIMSGGAKYSAWEQEPNSMLWTVRADGVLPTLTYMREEDVVGWARQVTDGTVESVAVIPSPDDTKNEVWISVLREQADGTKKRLVEYLNSDIYLDSALIYDGGNPGTATMTLTGLDHLEGLTVGVVADGIVYDDETVSSGEITITPAASYVVVGLNYTHTVVTMRPSFAFDSGFVGGLPKKWATVWCQVYATSSLTVNDEIIDFRDLGGTALGEEIAQYSGFIKISQSGWDDGRITLESSDPLPCTVLSVFGTLEVGSE